MNVNATIAERRRAVWNRIRRVALAAGLTVLLLLFMVFARWLDAGRTPEQVVRVMDLAPPLALPAPPPPQQEADEQSQVDLPNPPPATVDLPQLELQIEALAQPLVARLDPQIDLSMREVNFDVEVDSVPALASAPGVGRQSSSVPRPTPAVRSSYDAGELDVRPRLVNRPSAAYPRDQLRAGVKEGKVLLEVVIDNNGRVTVRRVITSSHADFTAMARKFAAGARFSVPKKNGQPVTAIYRWPLVLRP